MTKDAANKGKVGRKIDLEGAVIADLFLPRAKVATGSAAGAQLEDFSFEKTKLIDVSFDLNIAVCLGISLTPS